MVTSAVAQETVLALRRKISKIEGTLSEVLGAPAEDAARQNVGHMLLRRNGVASSIASVSTGVASLDAALGGGLPRAALTEIHGVETRDAGAVTGFVLSLCALLRQTSPLLPILWIGTSEIFGEAGVPYTIGLEEFGLTGRELLFAEAGKLVDALWIAEEAASLKALGAVILELRGNPQRLDLDATRRLHRRAQQAGRPLFLLRQGAQPEPTAAPVRLIVSPEKAGLRETLAGPLPRSIGPPAFLVTLSKSRTAIAGQFILEWNADGRFFRDRRLDPGHDRQQSPGSADLGAVLSLSRA